MKTVTHLAGEISETPFDEKHGARQSVHYEVFPGSFLNLELGAAGLRIHHGGTGVGITLQALAELAGRMAPQLAAIIGPPKAEDPAATATANAS